MITGVFTDAQRMICDARWKYITYPKADREQLFDLQHDPDEMTDLSRDPEHGAKRDEMRARLEHWRREHDDPNL